MESITAHGDQAKSAHRDLILMPSLVPSSTMRGMEHGAEDISAWTSNLYYCHKEPTLGHPLGLWVSTWVTLQFALGRTDPGGGLQNSGSRLMATGEGNPAYVAGGLEGEAWGSCGHSPSPPPTSYPVRRGKDEAGPEQGFPKCRVWGRGWLPRSKLKLKETSLRCLGRKAGQTQGHAL